MRSISLIVGLLATAGLVAAQEKGSEPKMQKEHEWLKQFEGKWDVKCKWTMPGQPAEETSGIEISRMSYGGFWLMCEFRGEFNKQSFDGHSMMGYEPGRKKFVGACIGSNGPNLMTMQGDADASGKKFTFKGECEDPMTGKPVTHKMVSEITDKDHRTERMWMVGDDGKETLVGEFFYTRKGKTEAK